MSEERHVRELQALNAEVRVCESEGGRERECARGRERGREREGDRERETARGRQGEGGGEREWLQVFLPVVVLCSWTVQVLNAQICTRYFDLMTDVWSD